MGRGSTCLRPTFQCGRMNVSKSKKYLLGSIISSQQTHGEGAADQQVSPYALSGEQASHRV